MVSLSNHERLNIDRSSTIRQAHSSARTVLGMLECKASLASKAKPDLQITGIPENLYTGT